MKRVISTISRFLKSLPGGSRDMEAWLPVYAAIVKQARSPGLFGPGAAEDDFDGRFEVLVMHVYLVLRRLKSEGQARHGAGQAVFDLFFRDMDQALREMGVGDLGVGKKIKKMAEAFYGRVAAYDKAVPEGAGALAPVIHRNLFADSDDPRSRARAGFLADYMLSAEASLAGLELDKVLSGDLFSFDNDVP